jgi:hypothetical protein
MLLASTFQEGSKSTESGRGRKRAWKTQLTPRGAAMGLPPCCLLEARASTLTVRCRLGEKVDEEESETCGVSEVSTVPC